MSLFGRLKTVTRSYIKYLFDSELFSFRLWNLFSIKMIKTDPWTGGTDEEYETQYFGFGAQRFKTSLRQLIEDKIREGVKGMETFLQESFQLNDSDKVRLSHSCNQLVRLYCERAGPSLHIIDDEIEKIMKVPANVLMPDDEVQIHQTTDEEYYKLKEEVANLRKRALRGRLMEALLMSEEEELASAKEVYETARKDMEVLDLLNKDMEESEGLNTLQEERQRLCTNVPFINLHKDASKDYFFDK